MADLRDFTGKNRRFTGTDAETITSGTTGERVDGAGKLRFNTTTNLMEYYDGNDWKAIDAPPVITGFTVDDVAGSAVTSATVDNEKSADSGLLTIEVLGSLFDVTGAGVTFIATTGNGEIVNTQSITRNSANKLTVTVTASDFDVANSPYTIRVTNGSGLSANLEACISADADAPVFTNVADTNYDIFDSTRASGTIAAADLIEASGVVASSSAYAVTTGAVPSGFTLNTTSGDITWSSVSAVGSDTQTLFTITATSTEGGTATRQFGITVKAPAITTYTSGSGNFTVPTGITAVDVLVVAGGGSGAKGIPNNVSVGGGGAGGLIYRPGFTVSPGATVAYSIGGTTVDNPANNGQAGVDTTFGTLTAKGGGGGGGWDGNSGTAGGSGGGGSSAQGTPSVGGSPATQPGQPGDSGTYGFGNSGGTSGPTWANGTPGGPNTRGGGGGGAGGAGTPGNQSSAGGAGKVYSISGSPVGYAGGGGGGRGQGTGPAQHGGGNGGTPGQSPAPSATSNRGGGGGGGGVIGQTPDTQGGSGGSGVVIVTF